VLEELEAQNETTATTLLTQKVSQLKSLTIAIGDEIRDSSTLASQINDGFENTTVRLRGTMRRMLRMAERTGVGWKVWVLFFLAVWAIFAYVWLF
jgi:blocked-early-in-transport protein 1